MSDRIRRRVDVVRWFSRVLGLDGALPVFVAGVSITVAWILPQHRTVAEVTMVTLPVLAFMVRLRIGLRHIRGNACGRIVQDLQVAALLAAILLFVLLDFWLASHAFLPPHLRHIPKGDIPVFTGIIVAYVLLALFAMFPGQTAEYVD